ncbi:MAG: hypothetical protein AAF216_05710 [Pseudomonadota bacterium]
MLRFVWLLPTGLIAACLAPEPPVAEPVCRPETISPAMLGIGPLEFAPQSVQAQVQEDSATGRFGITIQLDEDAAWSVATLTREQLGQPIELRLDEDVIASPVVHTPILDGRILISGDFTRFAATEIVERLAPPCLPDAAALVE